MFKGLQWNVNDSADKLKRIIWAGQGFRNLDDRLSVSLEQIHNAMETINHSIKQEQPPQHVELLNEYMNILEGFQKRVSNLSNVQVRIQLKIKHIINLRDGVSYHFDHT